MPAMSARFECPRCQTVFAAGDDEAFAECPSCGALAVPAGEATEAHTLHRALSHDPDATAEGRPHSDTSVEPPSMPPTPAQGAGIFQGLLSEDPDPGLIDPTNEDMRLPVAVPPPVTVGPSAPVDAAADAPTLQTPSLFAEETSSVSKEQLETLITDALSDKEEPTAEARAKLPPSLLLTRDEGGEASFDVSGDDGGAESASSSSGEGDAFSSSGEGDAWSSSGEGAATAADPHPAPELSARDEHTHVGSVARDGVWDRNYTSQEMPPSAVLLSSLEAETQGMVLFEAGNLSEDAFGALEAAFDEVAMRPDPPPPLPSRAEEALRAMSANAAMSGIALPTRPEEVAASVPAPPPLRRRRAPQLHLTLSEEAKALAGLPLGRRSDSTEVTARIPRARPAAAASPPPAARAPDREATDPVQRRVSRPTGVSAGEPELEAPQVFSGFTLGRVAAAFFAFLLVGGLLGVAIAPEPERRPATPRARAEQRFAEGNRFYQDGRFDDALGSYRGAIALDRTFAPAYRAKAAALAKQKRYEEAAAAYRAYLDIAPGAVDATAVQEVLERYEGGSEP